MLRIPYVLRLAYGEIKVIFTIFYGAEGGSWLLQPPEAACVASALTVGQRPFPPFGRRSLASTPLTSAEKLSAEGGS